MLFIHYSRFSQHSGIDEEKRRINERNRKKKAKKKERRKREKRFQGIVCQSGFWYEEGSRGLGVRCLPSIREVLGSNPLGGKILCSPSPLEETINRGPNTPIPTTHALICEELKDPGIPPKLVP